MADDWWASASKAHNNNLPRRAAPISAPPSVAAPASSSADQDPLLAGLSSAARRPETPAPVLRVPPAPTASAAARQRRTDRPTSASIADKLNGVELYELVERATGHARPPGKQDTSAVNVLVRSIRSRETRIETVLKACAVTSDGRGGSPHNVRVLNLMHILLSAGAHALPNAANGVCGATASRMPPALKLVSEAHRAARKGRGVGAVDVLGTAAFRDARTLDSNDRVEAAIYAAECYSVLLARRLTFAAQFAETECNYSLDRWYRRLGIENRADPARAGLNNAKQARLLAPDTRLLVLQLVVVAARCVILLSRAKAQREAVASVLAEACNAYTFSEYIRAKSNAGKPPLDEGRVLQDAIGLVAGGGVSALARFANIDENVAELCLSDVGEVAASVRIDSKYRRDIVCSFSSFMALHAALDPFVGLQTTTPNPANNA